MRRVLLWSAALLVLTAAPATAQLTVQTANGWSLTFAGNVNAFMIYEHESKNGSVVSPLALVGRNHAGSAIRSGLLPAFMVLDARGREGNTDLGVHFGLAPVIQTGGGHDNDSSSTQAGSRIDMRQVYLTVGGGWGQLLAGREIGLFARQNILTDQTLFGFGATGGNYGNPAGTTLGRIGFGYVYPNFNAQLTYSTPNGRPLQLSVGLFDPSTFERFNEVPAPRLESELTWTRGGTMAWAGGLVQYARDTRLDAGSTAWGMSGGVKYGRQHLTAVASGFVGQGIGEATLFSGGRSNASGSVALRSSRGFLAQLAYQHGTRLTLAASYGQGSVSNAADEPTFRITNSSVTTGAYYQATRSLKLVAELTLARANDDDPTTAANSSVATGAGLMLFF
jgi:hypothetical protein